MSDANNDDYDKEEKKVLPNGKFHSDSNIKMNNELNNNSKPDKQKKSIFNAFGPGIVTGASDDDPSGIATYSQLVVPNLVWIALDGNIPISYYSGHSRDVCTHRVNHW